MKKLKHNLIFWFVVVLIMFVWQPILGIVAVIFWLVFYYNEKQKRIRAKLTSQANVFIDQLKINKKLEVITTFVLLKEEERAIFEENSSLNETRSIRKSTGGTTGVRVAKGIYLGGYSGTSESYKEWRILDSGKLTLTNQRIIFTGNKENRIIPISKILSISNDLRSIKISVDGKAKNLLFPVKNSYIWCALIQILRFSGYSTEIQNVDLQIDFK